MSYSSEQIPKHGGRKLNVAIPSFFVSVSLLFLFFGLLLGFTGSCQYLFPDWIRNDFPFSRMRSLHVGLVISWIFTCATGGIYFYLQENFNCRLYSEKVAWAHAALLVIVSTCTFTAYSIGIFGGREYLEFPPWIGIPLVLYWILFMINFFKTVNLSFKKAPIYIWMWATGLIFFLITFLESQLWLLHFFSDNIIRDTVVQWKALGSMVGSWNMLVYGTAFYLMEKISGNDSISNSRQTFFFYFLGLTNLMFNWGHHTYIVPASPIIRNIAYIISMTELLILANIIGEWRSSYKKSRNNFHLLPYRFLIAADFWILLNLILAIAMSVPAINLYTHGTHITVAHAMGTTIGINTMILLASVLYFAEKTNFVKVKRNEIWLKRSFWISNISLLVFWASLLVAGIIKSVFKNKDTHLQIIQKQTPFFILITVSGFIMLIGFSILIFRLLRIIVQKKEENKNVFSLVT